MTNHDHLCPELRLQALCLPIPDRNTGGRPGLSFRIAGTFGSSGTRLRAAWPAWGSRHAILGLTPRTRPCKRRASDGRASL
jgi:hypothetical protein